MLKKLVFVTSLVAMNCFAGTQTWDFTNSIVGGNDTRLDGAYMGNSFSMNVDGITLTVTGWADSLGTTDTSNPHSETVEEAQLVYYGQQLGIINQDEALNDDYGTPNHSIDNYDSSRWGDDYEMVLLSFSEAVSLDQIGIGWAREDYGTNNEQRHADITTVAYTGSDTNTGSSSNGDSWTDRNLFGNSWAEVAADAAWTFVSDISNADDYAYHSIDNPDAVISNFWLVGAYNPVFSETCWTHDNDGFKLSKLISSSEDPTEVPEPTSIILFLSFGIAMLVKNKKLS